MPWILFFFLGGAAVAAGGTSTSRPKSTDAKRRLVKGALVLPKALRELSNLGAPYRFSDGVAIAEKLVQFVRNPDRCFDIEVNCFLERKADEPRAPICFPGGSSDSVKSLSEKYVSPRTWNGALNSPFPQYFVWRTQKLYRLEIDYWSRNPDRFNETQRLRGLIQTVILPILASEIQLISAKRFAEKGAGANECLLGAGVPNWPELWLDDPTTARWPILSPWIGDGSNKYKNEFLVASVAWLLGFWLLPEGGGIPIDPVTKKDFPLNDRLGDVYHWPNVDLFSGLPNSLRMKTEEVSAGPFNLPIKQTIVEILPYGDTAASQLAARKAQAVYWRQPKDAEEIRRVLNTLALRFGALLDSWCGAIEDLEPSPCATRDDFKKQLVFENEADMFRDMIDETNARRIDIISQIPLGYYIPRVRQSFDWTSVILLIFGTVAEVLGFLPGKIVKTAAEIIGTVTKVTGAITQAIATGVGAVETLAAISQGMLAAFQASGILQPKDLEEAKKVVDRAKKTAAEVEKGVSNVIAAAKAGKIDQALKETQGLIQTGKAAWQELQQIWDALKLKAKELEERIKKATGNLKKELESQLAKVRAEIDKVAEETRRLQARAGITA
jgi:hypothetical protein